MLGLTLILNPSYLRRWSTFNKYLLLWISLLLTRILPWCYPCDWNKNLLHTLPSAQFCRHRLQWCAHGHGSEPVHLLWLMELSCNVSKCQSLLPDRWVWELESRCMISTLLVPDEQVVPDPPTITMSLVPSAWVTRSQVWYDLVISIVGPFVQELVSIL